MKAALVTHLTLNTGARMPIVGLGTWESAPGVVQVAVRAALSEGCLHIDCASAYRNEAEVGAALTASGVPREDCWLTGKLWNDRRRPADVEEAVDQTLKDLQTDYLDLYLVHWPVVWARDTVMKPDGKASLREAWSTLERLVDAGKIRTLGVANYDEAALDELLSYARYPPAVNQIELHPHLPQRKLLAYCRANDIAVTAYSPLGRGNVKGAGLLTDPAVIAIASKRGVEPASVLLRWNTQRGVAVIPKSVSPIRIKSNSLEPLTFCLADDEIAALDALETGARYCQAPWQTFEGGDADMKALGNVLPIIARLVFLIPWLDITKK